MIIIEYPDKEITSNILVQEIKALDLPGFKGVRRTNRGKDYSVEIKFEDKSVLTAPQQVALDDVVEDHVAVRPSPKTNDNLKDLEARVAALERG